MKNYTLHGTLALLLVLALCLCLIPAAFAEELNVSDAEAFDADSMGKVIFDPNGGEGAAMEPIVAEIGSTITLPDCTFSRSGYNFAGWNTEPDGSGTSYGDVYNPNSAAYTFRRGELTLYAKWARAITVTLDPNGGTPETPKTISGSQGGYIDFPQEDRDRYGNTVGYLGVKRFDDASGRYYDFTGWNMVKDGTKADNKDTHIDPGAYAIVRINEDITLYAEWRKPVTIHYEANGGSGYMEDETACFVGDVVTLDKNTFTRDSEMLAFLGWNTKKDGSGTAYSDGDMFIIEDDLTLYAQWANGVIVSFDGNGATEGYMENQVVPANVLTILNKNTFKRDSYSFAGWNTDPYGLGTSYKNGDIVMLDRSVYLYAQWEQSVFNISFYDGDTFIKSVQVPKGNVIELIDYDMTGTGKVLTGWSLVKGRNVAAYTVGQGYTPTQDTAFYAVSGDAVTITYFINGDSSNTQIVARSTPTELRAFEDMGIDPPDATKYFKEWSDSRNTYRDRQTVSLAEDVVLVAVWADAEEPAPAAPNQVRVSKHLVNYGNELLNGHSGELSGIDTSMEYYYNGTWNSFSNGISTLRIAKPYNFEIRYAEKSYSRTPPSESVIRPVYSFMSEASNPENISTQLEYKYSYDVNIYSVRPSGAKTIVDSTFTDEGRALEDVLSIEEIYFLLDYPVGISKNSNMLTLMHDGRQVEIQQLSKGILGKANDFSNSEFVLYVEDKLYGTVTLSNTNPKAGETITATLSDTNLVGKPVYRWLRDGVEPITGYSTSNSYTLTGEDLMHTLSCEVKSANTPPTPGGSIESAETSVVRIATHESSATSGGIGYFEGVTSDMEYSTDDGLTWRPVSQAGTLQGNKLYVSTAAKYTFRHRGETDDEYWNGGELEAWYYVGYNISASSTSSSSGTVTFRNGTTTLSSSTRIVEDGVVIIQADDTNRWKVRVGANTNLNMVVRPSGSSYGYNTTYANVSLNGGEYATFTGERTFSLEPVNENKYYTIVFDRGEHSPGNIPIDEEHFPDPAFRSALSSSQYDRNYDGNLSEAEIAEITTFTCSNRNITSLKGIEYFDKLKVLYCSGNFLNGLDLSACKSLTSVYCNDNYLTELKLDGCASLSLLNCADNVLTELDLSACPNLTTLDCSGNSLTALSLDKNTALSSLMCQNNAISSLDLSDCGKLKTLTCADNVLRTLVLGENEVLSSLNCSNNRLTALDLSECAALKSLYCGNNSVTAVSLPVGMTRINSGAFRDCVSLRSIVIPDGVTIISSEAFRGCESLAAVTIPVSVARIGEDAFAGCGNLREIVYGGTEGQWQQINIAPGNEALGKNSGNPIGYDSAPDFTVPASLTTIEEEAFAGGAFIFVKLPDGIESIGPRAFAECPRLAFIRFSTQNVDIDATAFDGVTGLTFLGTPGGSVEAYAVSHGFIFQAE